MKFFEDELRKIFGESERLSEDTLFSDKTMISDIGDNLRAKVSFISTFVKDNYDALRIQIIHRDQGELDSHTLKFSDMIGIKNGQKPYAWIYNNKAEWYAYTPTMNDRELIQEKVEDYISMWAGQGFGMHM